jgi:phosphatidylethanolamine-binding protein (PEBP) family uncharacterized protein
LRVTQTLSHARVPPCNRCCDDTAYAGPGANAHEYLFKIYALKVASIAITLPGGANKQEAARMALEMSKDVIAIAMLRGATSP